MKAIMGNFTKDIVDLGTPWSFKNLKAHFCKHVQQIYPKTKVVNDGPRPHVEQVVPNQVILGALPLMPLTFGDDILMENPQDISTWIKDKFTKSCKDDIANGQHMFLRSELVPNVSEDQINTLDVYKAYFDLSVANCYELKNAVNFFEADKNDKCIYLHIQQLFGNVPKPNTYIVARETSLGILVTEAVYDDLGNPVHCVTLYKDTHGSAWNAIDYWYQQSLEKQARGHRDFKIFDK